MAAATAGEYIYPPGTDPLRTASAAQEDVRSLLDAYAQTAGAPAFAAFAAAWRSLNFSAVHHLVHHRRDYTQVLNQLADAALHMLHPSLPVMSRTCGAYTLYSLAQTSPPGRELLMSAMQKHWRPLVESFELLQSEGQHDAVQALQHVIGRKILVFAGGLTGESLPQTAQSARLWNRQEGQAHAEAGGLSSLDEKMLSLHGSNYHDARQSVSGSELRHSNALKLVEALSQLKRQFQSDRDQRLESTVEALAQVATVPKQRNQRLVKVTGRYSKIHEGIALAAAEAATAATPLSTTAIASSVNGNATTSAAAASELEDAVAVAPSPAPVPVRRGRGRPPGKSQKPKADAAASASPSPKRARRGLALAGHLNPLMASRLAAEQEQIDRAARMAAAAVAAAQLEAAEADRAVWTQSPSAGNGDAAHHAADDDDGAELNLTAFVPLQETADTAAEGANDADAQPVASRRGAGAKSAAKKSKTAAPAAVASQPQPQPAVEATAAATDSGEAGSESAQNGNTATEPGKKRRGRKPSAITAHPCPDCDRVYRFPSQLLIHQRSHNK